MKLYVRSKKYDEKGGLVGYWVGNSEDKYALIDKDKLKEYVTKGQVELIGFTLTSDGRLIGAAYKSMAKALAKNGERLAAGVRSTLYLTEVYTVGKDIIGGEMIESRQGGRRYVLGSEIEEMTATGKLNRTDNEKKKTFKSIYGKVCKNILSQVPGGMCINVAKAEKNIYNITFNNKEELFTPMSIVYAMKLAKIKVEDYDRKHVTVKCLTGINDVRAALKAVELHKM